MRIIRFDYSGRNGFGFITDEGIVPVAWEPYYEFPREGWVIPLSDVQILAPVEPTKIVAVGLNYTDHAEELGMPIPDKPILFLKAPNTLVGHGGMVMYPEQSLRVDYEAELAVVMGKHTKSVPEKDALSCVLGYSCSMDITARDLQAIDGQWTRAKNFDTFCPLGPWIETEVDPSDLGIELKLNGEVRQSSRTSKMIFNVPQLISFISSVMTLYPGDVILTGTPSGVGEVKKGDTIETIIEDIGTLTVSVG